MWTSPVQLKFTFQSAYEEHNYFMHATEENNFFSNLEQERTVGKEYIFSEKKYTTFEDLTTNQSALRSVLK